MSAPARYRLVVFDWDGTLIDSIGSIVECTRCALADAGVESPAESVLRGAIGLGLLDSIAGFFPTLDADTRDHILDRYRHHWVETWHARHEPFPATRATLAAMRAQGVRIGVATAKSRRGLVRDLERTGLGPLVDAARTLDECPPKPSPEMLHELMAELAATPAETLMVGDTRWDLEMAHHAGVDAIGVLSGAQPEAELRRCPTVACLAHVGELGPWLEAQAAALAPR